MKVGPTYPLGLTYLVQNLGHHFPSIPNTCRGEGLQGCGGRVVKQHGRKQKSLQEKKTGRWAIRTEPSIVQEAIKLKDLFNLTSVQIPGPAERAVLSMHSEYLKLEET